MRINKWHLSVAAALFVFFSYLGYREFFFDDTASAKAAIQQDLAKIALPSTPTDAKPAEYYGNKRAEIALQEYAKNVVEVPRGCNCGPEVDKYTQSSPGQWCTSFASWIANEAGSPLIDAHTKDWRISNSRIFTENLKLNGTFYTADEIMAQGLKPRIGDFVVFWRGNLEDNLGHIDVVVKVNDDGSAGLIGGNIRDRIAYREDFPFLHSYGFLGFGRPEK